ncbi:MAG: hypothetical protein JETCAE02_27490 [Anaerolineaceae bacterium]|nr:MAG: hypothetical protein BroJett001_01540 [Chloroflexota bacterium]GJQ40337.1 MAG: hypothetical protein JETCAE02_27490 [Anaerolineaceae bacterium]
MCFKVFSSIDILPIPRIIPPNKNIDEDEYALDDGSREQAVGESPARDDSAEWTSELQGELFGKYPAPGCPRYRARA